jgi:hypothetical protein
MKMFLREKQRIYAVEVLITEQLVKNCGWNPALQLRRAGSWAGSAWYVSKEICKHRV